MKKSAQTDKSSQSYGNSKFWWRASDHSANIECSNMGGFCQGGPKIKKSKNFKIYQVDMFWKGKIERNTMQVFLDWFNASVESYTKKTVKMFPFYWFFEFLRHKKLSDFYHFCTSYFIYCTEALCKFSLKTDSIYYLKSSKNTYFGPIFRGGYRFFAILTHKTQSNHLETTLNRFYGQK